MTETEFKKAMADAWVVEVEGILQQVETLLQQVAEECQTQPYEDDTIMMTLKQTGDVLSNAWEQLDNIFKDIITETKNIFKEIGVGVARAVEQLQNAVNSMTH